MDSNRVIKEKYLVCKYCKHCDTPNTEQPCVRCNRNRYLSDYWEAHPLTRELMELELMETEGGN